MKIYSNVYDDGGLDGCGDGGLDGCDNGSGGGDIWIIYKMNLTKEYSPSFIRASFDSFSQLKQKNKHFLLLRLFPRLFKQNSFEIRRNHG